MKRYYISCVDFSEIENITAEKKQLDTAIQRLRKLNILTEKGNPSQVKINALVREFTPEFFDKLSKRGFARYGGITTIKDTLEKLVERKEYIAFYLYLSLIYGYIGWQIPERISLLPAAPETLKIYASAFIAAFDKFLSKQAEKENPNEKNT